MSNLKKIVLAVVLLGLAGMAYFAYTVYDAFLTPNTNFETQTYEILIPTGSNYDDAFMIAAAAVKDRDNFHTTAIRRQYNNAVRPGRFIIEKGMSNFDIVRILKGLGTPVTLRFNNQERLQDLAGRIASQIEMDSITAFNMFTEKSFLDANGFDEQTVLSMYLPNQYEVYWDISPEDLRAKMLEEYKRFWNEERLEKAALLNLTPLEISTLAAIVHKETAKIDERPTVAGVYLNRLKIGMPLQADPTVIYAVKKNDNNFSQIIKQVLFKDLTITSPYNTYVNVGLPPGPICMPDLTAIDAVLNAEKHDYLFFVANTQRFGYHKFAKNLAEHSKNAAEYRAWVAKQDYSRTSN